jgi:hypothetical protein
LFWFNHPASSLLFLPRAQWLPLLRDLTCCPPARVSSKVLACVASGRLKSAFQFASRANNLPDVQLVAHQVRTAPKALRCQEAKVKARLSDAQVSFRLENYVAFLELAALKVSQKRRL